MKAVTFLGDSLEALRDFPDSARRNAGFQIDRVQRGLEPDHWKPMKTIGAGVREIRIYDAAGAFRVLYTAVVDQSVYVLHAFQKKSQSTAQRDLDLASVRYAQLMRSKR